MHTIPGQSGSGSNGNKGILQIALRSSSGGLPSDGVIDFF